MSLSHHSDPLLMVSLSLSLSLSHLSNISLIRSLSYSSATQPQLTTPKAQRPVTPIPRALVSSLRREIREREREREQRREMQERVDKGEIYISSSVAFCKNISNFSSSNESSFFVKNSMYLD